MINDELLIKAYRLMCTARAMAETYEANRNLCPYVHSTSQGHEAVQLAAAFQLLPQDFVSPYYRDESILLGLGFTPYQLMLQLLAKRDDIFSAGRSYYSHPSSRDPEKAKIIHQSSATGMQAIPATGIAQGLQYKSLSGLANHGDQPPVVLCSIGDASITEGEVSEALQVAVLKKLPILYLVQDNGWGISATRSEVRAMDAYEYAAGFPGLARKKIDGTDFLEAFLCIQTTIENIRNGEGPCLIMAELPLLGHHTSGVRREFYRNAAELEEARGRDPLIVLKQELLSRGIGAEELDQLNQDAKTVVSEDFKKAVAAPDPDPADVGKFIFAPTPVTREQGRREGNGREKILMVDAAVSAIREIMEDFPEAIFFGQDIGRRLGGVFREAAGLAEAFGEERVFNTAIQEAYIIGSTAGLSAVGLKPIVEIQFGDYIFPGFNQLVTEISKSSYLTNGKYPVQVLIRIPVGAYGGGGPYHSASIETALLSIKGIKVVYPSNAADMKGLMKAAFIDPNPVIMLEHKGLYWSKNPGSHHAKTFAPDRAYAIPLGVGRIALHAGDESVRNGDSCVVVTYGMGVHWAMQAAEGLGNRVEVLDLRTLYPLDETLIYERVKLHGKCLVLTEEQQNNSFAEALAGRISKNCFQYLDAAVTVLGAMDLPAMPINFVLEAAVLPNADKLGLALKKLLDH